MDLTAIAAAAASVAATPAPAVVTVPASLPPADGAAAARFAEIMRPAGSVAPDDPAGPAALTSGIALPVGSMAPGRPLNLGESILSTMQNVSNDMRAAHGKIQAVLDPNAAPLTLQQGLSLQFQVAVTSLQYDLLGKVVSKSIQNVDQLVKMP
ncbi:type III secretion system inner rod subunit SctI [Ramlibacter sp. MAHUQ-53]|uniref:type III secretion system inner rod subunit SctI n=1 Tax=unclassified Ramlibacter TaxID=2617605 RepID=UPI00362519C5